MSNKYLQYTLSALLIVGVYGNVQAESTRYGEMINTAKQARVVELTPKTRSVNVTNGETVTFEKSGKRFTWHVYTYPYIQAFALKAIAPADMDVTGIIVYVAPDERYRD